MKCGVAAFVVASLNLADKLARSPGLELVITAGEETGCEGAFHLTHKSGALGRAGAVVVGEPSSNYPFVGHRGAFWLNARTRGVTAHGSMPEKGVNAVFKAARAVAILEKFRFTNPPHPLMGQATLNVGTIRGGLNINSVPDEAVIGVDIRTIPSIRHAELKAELMRQLGEEVELETILDLESVFTEPTHPWIQEVFEVMQTFLGQTAGAAGRNLLHGRRCTQHRIQHTSHRYPRAGRSTRWRTRPTNTALSIESLNRLPPTRRSRGAGAESDGRRSFFRQRTRAAHWGAAR